MWKCERIDLINDRLSTCMFVCVSMKKIFNSCTYQVSIWMCTGIFCMYTCTNTFVCTSMSLHVRARIAYSCLHVRAHICTHTRMWCSIDAQCLFITYSVPMRIKIRELLIAQLLTYSLHVQGCYLLKLTAEKHCQNYGGKNKSWHAAFPRPLLEIALKRILMSCEIIEGVTMLDFMCVRARMCAQKKCIQRWNVAHFVFECHQQEYAAVMHKAGIDNRCKRKACAWHWGCKHVCIYVWNTATDSF